MKFGVVKFVTYFLFVIPSIAIGQLHQIKGKISNSYNAEAMPYMSVYAVMPDGSKVESTTDFDGFYLLNLNATPDSLVVKNDGFQTQRIGIKNPTSVEYDFQIVPEIKKTPEKKVREKNIDGVLIKKQKKNYSNPAYEILEKFVARKPQNNPDKFQSYSYENYNRMEISMSNFGKKIEKRKVYKEIKNLLEANSDSAQLKSPVLPVFISENLSDIYYQKSPDYFSEIIKKSKVDGIGIEDGTMFSQLVSSTFIKYNFYNNYIRILGKDFLSPVNDNFKLLYDYELVNKNFMVDGMMCYLLKFKPKRESDLAFEGTVVITHGTYALYRMDAKVTSSANLNFINNLRIQQEMVMLPETDNWFPGKTRVFVETAKPGKESMSIFLKYYASAKNIVINQPIDPKLFEKKMVILKDAESNNDPGFWEKNRHDSLSVQEKKMFATINEVKNLPAVKSYLDIIDLLLNGYYKVGAVGFGPFLYTVGYNNHEGLRLRLGFLTNKKFSDKWILGGYLSYGFLDQKFKYGANVDYIFSRDPWIQGGVAYSHDLGQVAFQYEDFALRRNNIFDSFTKNGKMKLRKPFWSDTYQAYLQANISNSVTGKITFKHYSFDPLFPFQYRQEESLPYINDFKTSEVIAETVWRPGRRILETNSNKQISVKDNVYNPMVTLRYTRGMKGIFGSDFAYNKFHVNIQQTVPMGVLGRGEYSLTAGIIPDKIPYPLLENHLGNQFVFYNKYAFNMMNFFEFTSNKYLSLQYTQNLEGLITNSLPLIKKLNWRNHIIFNYLVGSLDPSFVNNSYGKHTFLQSLNNKPYMELGYGVSNIFRFLRIDFIHRLNHLDSHKDGPAPPKFSVKVSAQIRL